MKYDLVVLGGGSGGVACARRSAALGAKVALIEADRLGGTCVIRGCVPKKLLMYASGFKNAFNDSRFFGWEKQNNINFDMSVWQRNKTEEIKRLEQLYKKLLIDSGVDVIMGYGKLIDSTTLRIDKREIKSHRIMIATGGKPANHAINGLEKCMTSNEILDLDYLPKKLAVLGSGYISLEFASIFKKLGSDVSVFFRSDFPLKGFDLDIRKKIANDLIELGINLHPNSQIQSVEKHNNNFFVQTKAVRQEFSEVLNGLGRTPNSGNIGLETLGINLGLNGEICVN